MTSRTWVFALVSALAVAGCTSGHVAEAQPVQFTLNQPFVLEGGQEATLTGDSLRLRFSDLLEDSRCPKAVECFWTGQARIGVTAQPVGQEPTRLEFNTNPAPGQNVQLATVDGYTVTFQSLDPYPETPDESPDLEDYRATLSVGKG
jgi:hypothetical protein